MTERGDQYDSQNDHGPGDQLHGSLDRATLDRLVRCAADGELTDEEVAAYDAAKSANAKLATYERHERELRQAVGRCMCEGCACPQALRDRIAAMATGGGLADQEQAPALGIAGTPADRPVQRSAFPRASALVALAASVVVVVAVALYMQNNQPTQPGGSTPGGSVAQAEDLPTGIRLASFMTGEHNRCASHASSIRKFTERDLERVPQAFREVLGEEVSVEDLLLGEATFIAAGYCRVPGKGRSIHMMYEAFDTQGQPVEVSLYIQRCGDKRFEEGKAYAVGAEADSASTIGWRSGELVYYLVTDSADTTQNLAERLQAPAVAGAI